MILNLINLEIGETATITQLEGEFINDLLRYGFLEGEKVTLIRKAPLGGDPICVRVRDGLVALRSQEAKNVIVQKTKNQGYV